MGSKKKWRPPGETNTLLLVGPLSPGPVTVRDRKKVREWMTTKLYQTPLKALGLETVALFLYHQDTHTLLVFLPTYLTGHNIC